jgi:putative ABC transport system permease protein
VVASGTASTYLGPAVHDITSFGLDSRSLSLNGAYTAVSLPGLDRTGVMVDFGTVLGAARSGLAASTQLEVYVAPDAPSDLTTRLAEQGVHVVSVVRASTLRDRLDHTGPAYADGLFLIAAGVATALALGATVLAGVTTARRRSYELAALKTAGVRPRTLRLSAAVEQGILLVAGLVVGLVAGIVGARLALPSTPIFIDPDSGPPIEHRLPVGLLAILSAVLVVVFAVTSLVIARFVSHQASATRLREAQA